MEGDTRLRREGGQREKDPVQREVHPSLALCVEAPVQFTGKLGGHTCRLWAQGGERWRAEPPEGRPSQEARGRVLCTGHPVWLMEQVVSQREKV